MYGVGRREENLALVIFAISAPTRDRGAYTRPKDTLTLPASESARGDARPSN